MANYPNALPATAPANHGAVRQELLAIATELGTAPRGTHTTVKARLEAISASASVLRATVKIGAHTLTLADAGTVVEVNTATGVVLTVPPNSAVPFPLGTVITVCQYGAGRVTIAPGAGVTLRTTATLTTRTQYAEVSLRKRATDEWVVAGETT